MHSLDLGKAIGVNQEPPQDAMAVAVHFLADLAIEFGHAVDLTLVATGRTPRKTFSVLGA